MLSIKIKSGSLRTKRAQQHFGPELTIHSGKSKSLGEDCVLSKIAQCSSARALCDLWFVLV